MEPACLPAHRWRRLVLRSSVHMMAAAATDLVDALEEGASHQRLRTCLHGKKLLSARGNCYFNGMTCDRSKGGCGAIVNYVPTPAALEARRNKKDKSSGRPSPLMERASRLGSSSTMTGIPKCARCSSGMTVHDPQPGYIPARWRCSTWPTCRVLCPRVDGKPFDYQGTDGEPAPDSKGAPTPDTKGAPTPDTKGTPAPSTSASPPSMGATIGIDQFYQMKQEVERLRLSVPNAGFVNFELMMANQSLMERLENMESKMKKMMGQDNEYTIVERARDQATTSSDRR